MSTYQEGGADADYETTTSEMIQDGEETNGYLRSVGINLQLESTYNDSDTDESMEDGILVSARNSKREATEDARNASIGSIYSFERKEREAVNDMSVSFAQ